MSILVVDVGTSGVRCAVVDRDGSIRFDLRQPNLPDTPFAGLVEFDAEHLGRIVLDLATAATERAGDVTAVGIANQRASTIVWDDNTGVPVGPALGWQDLRTLGDCLVMRAEGLRLSPNATATKAAHLVQYADGATNLRVGTVDTWVARTLSGGTIHITDASNAGVTDLTAHTEVAWDQETLTKLGLDLDMMPTIVDSTGVVGHASALPGAPPIAGIAGDQQASLVGQGCLRPGMAKITFGTGAMFDMCVGDQRPSFTKQSENGTFPIVAWQQGGTPTWGIEAVMLSAGTNVEWLRDDLGLITTAAESHDLASTVHDTGGVVYVPALLGLGAPEWDFGARGSVNGITRGTTAAHLTRAVLNGVAMRGAELVSAGAADSGQDISVVRVDGGMSTNPTFMQALANAVQQPIERSAEPESTTLGAAFLAGLATGFWSDFDEVAALWNPAGVIEPLDQQPVSSEDWEKAKTASKSWYPELSAISF